MKFSISVIALLAVAFACEAGGVQQQQFQRQRQRQFAQGGCVTPAGAPIAGCGQPAQQQFFQGGGYQQNFQRSFRQQQFYQQPVIQQAPLVYQQQQVVQQDPIVYQQPPVLLAAPPVYGAGYGVGAGVGFFPARKRLFSPGFAPSVYAPAAPLLQFNFGRNCRY